MLPECGTNVAAELLELLKSLCKVLLALFEVLEVLVWMAGMRIAISLSNPRTARPYGTLSGLALVTQTEAADWRAASKTGRPAAETKSDTAAETLMDEASIRLEGVCVSWTNGRPTH